MRWFKKMAQSLKDPEKKRRFDDWKSKYEKAKNAYAEQ